MDDDDCDIRARILAKAQLKLSKLSVDSLRTVRWTESIRKSSVSPRFVKCPTDIYVVPHQTAVIEARKIKERPRFLQQLETTNIVAGRKGKLEVIVTGVPSPVVKWYKNWIPLEENENIQICQTDPDHYVLNIYAAQPTDSGLYTCKARNDSGSVNCSAMVHVDANNNVYYQKPHRPSGSHAHIPCDSHDSEWTSEWTEDVSEDFSRIRDQLRKLAEDFRQNEEIDLLYKKEVAKGKYRLPKV